MHASKRGEDPLRLSTGLNRGAQRLHICAARLATGFLEKRTGNSQGQAWCRRHVVSARLKPMRLRWDLPGDE